MDEEQLVVSDAGLLRSEEKPSPKIETPSIETSSIETSSIKNSEDAVPVLEEMESSEIEFPTVDDSLIHPSEEVFLPVVDEDLTSDGEPQPVIQESIQPLNVPLNVQVRFKTINRQLYLIIPSDRHSDRPSDDSPSRPWSDTLTQLEQRLQGTEKFWIPQTPVYLQAFDRLLDVSQLQEINSALTAYSLKLAQVITRRRQTAINAVTAGFSVEQTTAPNTLQSPSPKAVPTEDPLYLQMTLRAGTEVRHGGSIIIFGDVNGGAEVFAEGDILVWGKLRGLAHAGCAGNPQAVVMALSLMPTQLRIADSIAMVAPWSHSPEPEIAYVSGGRVIIVPAKEFDRNQDQN